MFRKLSLFLLAALLTTPLFAQGACNLQMSVTCTAGAHGVPSECTAVTVNAGTNACVGEFYTGWFITGPSAGVSVSSSNPHGGECFNSADFPGIFEDFTFSLCFGLAHLAPGASFRNTGHFAGPIQDLPIVGITFVGDEEGNELGSAFVEANLELPTCTPEISAPPVTQSGVEYTVSWTRVSDTTAQYVVEESTSADFSANTTQRQINGLSTTFRHDNMSTTTTYYYRVRATHCGEQAPPFSGVASTVVQAPQTQSKNPEAVVPFGSRQPVTIQVFIPGIQGKDAVDTTYTAGTDKPYLTVTPATGILPAGGTTVSVVANPADLPAGANTGTLTITSNGATVATTPVTVSLVTPVTPVTKGPASSNALVIPVVTHVNGSAGPFLSDVRLTNASSIAARYEVTMTPTRTNAATSPSKATPVSVDAGATIALNDIAKNFFGFGATGAANDIGFGSLEIRPLEGGANTYASSRTYASTAAGTFGQFIAAVPFTRFATRRTSNIPIPGSGGPNVSSLLSLQQVAQSAKFRTNLGIVEGAGEPASGVIRIFNNGGSLLKEVGFNLLPGEHQQINNFISASGVPTLEDGRIEIDVTSSTGAVTAYASVLDNLTTDPLAVMPVDVSKVSASRYVLPGMADLNNGPANFHSDIRIFNGGSTEALVNLTYYPQNRGEARTATPLRIGAGQIAAVDNVLPTIFNTANSGGSIVITTSGNSQLVATGRTYSINASNNGTFGQFIPGVTPGESVGRSDRSLHVLQLEHSADFRTNVGLAETTGNPAKVEVALVLPDTLATPVLTFDLAPNEFRQFSLGNFGAGSSIYNARVTVTVVEGTGRVTAYGSVVDNDTQDPTYVPAQ